MSAYQLFCDAEGKKIRYKSSTEIKNILFTRWCNLPESQKKQWEAKHQKIEELNDEIETIKKRYQTDFIQFDPEFNHGAQDYYHFITRADRHKIDLLIDSIKNKISNLKS